MAWVVGTRKGRSPFTGLLLHKHIMIDRAKERPRRKFDICWP